MSDGDTRGTFGKLKHDLIISGVTGVVVAIIIVVVTVVMGAIGDAEARRLLEAVLPTSSLFCSAILTVTATILALMLTMIGLGSHTDTELADAHYHRIVKIAFYDAILFCASAIMFVLHCVPVYESDELPNWWYPSIYYGVLIVTSLLAGGAVSIVVLLYLAVKDIVQVIGLGQTDNFYAAEIDGSSLVENREHGHTEQPNNNELKAETHSD